MPRTWQVELGVVAVALGATWFLSGGGYREALGSCAVVAGFAHAQVADRLAEQASFVERLAENMIGERLRAVDCWRWARRYYVTKEALWLGYFLSLQAWAALVGVVVFLAYPLWRAAYRRFA